MLYASNFVRKNHLSQEFIAVYESISINPFPPIVFRVKLGTDGIKVNTKNSHFQIWKVNIYSFLLEDDEKCILKEVKNHIFSFDNVDTIWYSRFANLFLCDKLTDCTFDKVE